ncbi:TetR/AcrR family transcriptional regulator [Streptomyces sp. NPDC101776]|uniref:TetR/AcrR family transcriptional regulator n=1 Tax=Streptomyces sp. NPDC101776 TaxID=3366146 RepID=UPI003800D2E0
MTQVVTRVATVPGRRGRGRPPRLSRERIVEGAVEVLLAEPNVSLTIKRVADVVGAAPMALYRYFPDRDALLQATADHVLEAMRRDPIPDGPWPDRLRAWMRAGQANFRPYPQLMPYMTTTRHPAWIPGLTRLREILTPAGLSDEDLALAVALISSTMLGHAVYEGYRRPDEEMTALLDDTPADDPRAEALRPLLTGLPAAHARLHDTILDQTVTTVERLAAGSACRPRT